MNRLTTNRWILKVWAFSKVGPFVVVQFCGVLAQMRRALLYLVR